MAPRSTPRTSSTGVRPGARREADVVHEPPRDDERHAEHRRAQQVGHAQVGRLGDHAAEHRPGEHRRAADRLGPCRRPFRGCPEAGRRQGVDQPRLGRAREEREPEAEDDRGHGPADERRVDVPHDQVQQGRDEQRRRPEQEGEAPAARVGDDPGRDLEHHLPDREERVGRERLVLSRPGVEQEEGVDAPDERRGERGQQGQDEVGALDGSGGVGHGRVMLALLRRGRGVVGVVYS